MILNIIYLITSVSLLIYLYYLYLFYIGLKNRNNDYSKSKPFISVVVATRNEEHNIARLLTTLVNQSYPVDQYQIIIANDGSTDGTVSIVEKFSQKWNMIKLVEVSGRESAISPKKNALTQAIDVAQGEIILSTDADCQVGKYWIESMVSCFEDNEMELYDLSSDIGERDNLVLTEPSKSDELLRHLQDWWKKTNAPIPTVLNPEYEEKSSKRMPNIR